MRILRLKEIIAWQKAKELVRRAGKCRSRRMRDGS